MELIAPLIAYSAGKKTIYSVSGAAKVSSSGKKGEVFVTPSDAVELDQNKSTIIAFWGENNDFPQKIDEEIEKNPTLAGALLKKIEYLYAGGIEFVQEVIENNQISYTPVMTPELRMLKDSIYMKQYLSQAIFDYFRYGSIFPEIVFSIDKSKALFLTEQQAYHCRWQKQDPSDGIIKQAFINRNWALGRKETSPDTITVPVLDEFFQTIDEIKADTKNYKYIFRSYIPSSKTYYPLVNWWTVKISGWLDISNYIPTYKKSLMARSITADFHIEVDVKWLEKKYEEKWISATPEQKQAIFLEELRHFNEMRQGADKAGGNIMTSKFWDDTSQKEVSAWVIHDLKQANRSGEYIEDSNEADSKIHYAVGLDMTMSNTKSGSGMGSGSGSDKREAFNMAQSTQSLHEDIILAPIYWMMSYNGLNPNLDIKIRMKAPLLQTLNQVAPAQRETTNN